jgi:hypothetical protein
MHQFYTQLQGSLLPFVFEAVERKVQSDAPPGARSLLVIQAEAGEETRKMWYTYGLQETT